MFQPNTVNLFVHFLAKGYFLTVALLPCLAFSQNAYSEKEILSEQLFIQAESKRLLGRCEAAIEILEEIRKKSPANTAVLYSLSRCYWDLNEIESAQRITEDALRFEPRNRWLLDLQLKLLERTNNYPQAVEVADKLFILTEDPVFLDKKAYFLSSLGRFSESLAALKELEQKAGISKDILLAQTQLLEELEKPREALQKIEKNLSEFESDLEVLHTLTRLYLGQGEEQKALAVLQQILVLEEKDPLALSLMGKLESQHMEGEHSLRQMIGNPKIPIDQKIRGLYPQLERLMESQQLSEPLLDLSLLLSQVHSQDPKAQAFLGDVLYQSGQIHRSIEPYTKTLELSSSNYQVYVQLLKALLYTRDANQFILVAEKTLDLYPDQARSYLYMAQAMHLNQAYAEGLNYTNEGLFMTGSDQHLKAELLLTKAELHLSLGNLELAENTLHSALEVYPDYSLAKGTLALLLTKKGLKPDEKTLKYLKKLALQDPMLAEKIADLLLALGQLNEAEELVANTGAQFKDFYPPILEKWGDLLLLKNSIDEAFQIYTQALSRMPNHSALLSKMNP
jgi:tetratricopeptide (TPR) repeat protein